MESQRYEDEDGIHETRASSNTLAMAQSAQRENGAIRKVIESMGCMVKLSASEGQLDISELVSYSI
jgi:hypothetical protein